jgi:hypothetical protein
LLLTATRGALLFSPTLGGEGLIGGQLSGFDRRPKAEEPGPYRKIVELSSKGTGA